MTPLVSPVARRDQAAGGAATARAAGADLRRPHRIGGASALVLTLSSATLYALAFPPFSLGPIAWIALAPLYVVCAKARLRVAVGCGILWGIAAAYGVGWWFPGMVSSYFDRSLLVGWLVFFATSFVHGGIHYGLFAGWLSWCAARGPVTPLLVAAGWGACEFARTRLFVGNPWALAGYSQVHFPALMQIADTTSVYGVGMLLAAVNASVASLAVPALRGHRPRAGVAAVAGMLLLTLVYGAWRLDQRFGSGPPIPVALVQGAVERADRWQEGRSDVSLKRYVALSRDPAALRPALLVWPENAMDFYLQDDSPERRSLLASATDLGTDVILGGLAYAYGASGIRYHNSVFLVREGRLAGRYDKIRLLPFAEGSHALNVRSLAPGRSLRTLRARVGSVAAFVCLESMYPEFVRSLAPAAELLANVSNDGWFGHQAPAEHQLEVASVRAIENRRYLVRAATTGLSAVVDPHGRVIARSQFGSPAVLAAEVQRSAVTTPYQRWGDVTAWGATLVAVGMAIRMTIRSPRRDAT